ncbi:hypothetical protein [Sulfitobacter donghicola]|nr:hypothetical protein [Sulfitobacter donghicola]
MSIFSKLPSVAAVAIAAIALAAPVHAGTCYNSIPDRDKWLGNWVKSIPPKGQKAQISGKEYSRAAAISQAKKDITEGYSKRGSDVNESPAGLSALAMIKAKNNEAKAMKIYARSKQEVSWEDATACWR